jgi:hypothetical protein
MKPDADLGHRSTSQEHIRGPSGYVAEQISCGRNFGIGIPGRLARLERTRMLVRTSVLGLLVPGLVLAGKPAVGAETPAEPITVNVYGDHNVIATDGSVLTVGDHSQVKANSGDVASSGVVGVASDDSTFESGAAKVSTSSPLKVSTPSPPPVRAGVRPRGPGSPAWPDTHAPRALYVPREPWTTAGTASAAQEPDRFPFPIPVSGAGQGTSISGYEDHSVSVAGEDQIAVYDDSNLFVNRDGRLNSNTGDTDSSGLNAVDVSGSTVRSGNQTENDESDEEEEEEDEETEDEETGTAGPPENGRPAAPGARQAGQGMSDGTPPSGSGGRATSTVTDEGTSSAAGASSLTIGADGYDNLGIDAQGKRNIVTYDDSNVVVGGAGDVNAQIGDSDTSGAVVMGIDGSDVRAGDST